MGAESTVLGIASGIAQGNIQQHFNQQNQAMQIEGQKEMGRFNNELQMDIWNRTNYLPQVKQMEKAGLNVGLMYKGAGEGGRLGQINENVAGQQTPIDIHKGMGMLLEAEAVKSQIEVNKTQATKNEAEAKEVEARTPTYEKGMQKTDAEIQEIATKLGVNIETAKKLIQDVEASKTNQDVQRAEIPKIASETGLNEAIQAKTEAETNRINILTPLEAHSIEQDIKRKITENVYLDAKERQELNNMVVEGVKMVREIQQGWAKLSIEERRNKIETFREEMKAKNIGVQEVVGKQLNSVINMLENVLNKTIKNLGGDIDKYRTDRVK